MLSLGSGSSSFNPTALQGVVSGHVCLELLFVVVEIEVVDVVIVDDVCYRWLRVLREHLLRCAVVRWHHFCLVIRLKTVLEFFFYQEFFALSVLG